MRDSHLKLKEKTVVLLGPLNLITQGITTVLTEMGANIAFVHNDIKYISKFVENTNIARESNPYIGKTIPIDAELTSSDAASVVFGKVAEYFGTVDIIINATLIHSDLISLNAETTHLETSLNSTQNLIKGGLPYLTGRKKGRIINLNYSVPPKSVPSNKNFKKIHQFLEKTLNEYSSKIIGTNVTINNLILGPTEDSLLKSYPDANNLKDAFSKLKEKIPNAKILEAIDIANCVSFLSSPMSIAINGQCIPLNYGA